MEKEQKLIKVAREKHVKPQIYSHHSDIIGRSRIPSGEAPNQRYIEYRRQWEENPIEFEVSDFPLHLNIEASGECNLMCRHCVRHVRPGEVGNIDLDLFKRIVDEGAEHRLCSISPEWLGEPFIHPQIIEMIKYAKDRGVLDVRVNTNGTLIDEKKAREIIDSGLDEIIFSVDAVTQKTYNRIKPGNEEKNYFRIVNENIERLLDLKKAEGVEKPVIYVQMIDLAQNHEELRNFTSYWRHRADMVRIAEYQSPGGNRKEKNRILNSPESIFPCPQLWQRLSITWDGLVYPCGGAYPYAGIAKESCEMFLGDLKKGESLYDIWHGRKMNYLREKHEKYEADSLDGCRHCDLNKIPKEINNYKKEQRSEME